MNIPDVNAPFSELQEFIYRTYHPDIQGYHRIKYQFWENIQKNPIDRGDINGLRMTWSVSSVEMAQMDINSEASCDYKNKLIKVVDTLSSFKRDSAICHEIVHANYGAELSGDWPIYENDKTPFNLNKKCNRVLAEWYARQIRATPTLLSSIWRAFNIEPKIYDRASLTARDYLDEQKLFNFFYRDFNFTLMD